MLNSRDIAILLPLKRPIENSITPRTDDYELPLVLSGFPSLAAVPAFGNWIHNRFGMHVAHLSEIAGSI